MRWRKQPDAFRPWSRADREPVRGSARRTRVRPGIEALEDRTLLATNPIVTENLLPGSPPSEWQVSGVGDTTLQGFATDISVNQGQTISFKINDTTRASYHIDLYRLGYYGGMGARKVSTISSSSTTEQVQQAGILDSSTGLLDCGNWLISASWAVPSSATSGIYIARLVRDDTGGASQIPFIVRSDTSRSDILYQTSDSTWQAYNNYGGNSLYEGSSTIGGNRAVKVSYNRPWNTAAVVGGAGASNWLFWAEYPMVRWMEQNGYDVSYFTDMDADRRGSEILEHKIYLSSGHDEYWSGGQRTNVEAARDAGVDLAFFSGNNVFWKTRWENSNDGSNTPYRTLVCYKETHAAAKIDPLANVWTGTWRDPRFSPPADGGKPENALVGTIFTVNRGQGGDFGTAIQVPSDLGQMRLWRNTSVATLGPGQTATLANGTLGYEWNEDLDNGFRPAGLIPLSMTVESVPERILDYGSNYGPATATHSLTLYRAASGALVFSAGTVQWSFGLDSHHDGPATTPDVRMEQATVNLLADMGAQPGTLMAGLVSATASTDQTRPSSVITSPLAGATLQTGVPITIRGTATDGGGGIVAVVEISTDGGATWHRATGRNSWTYTWTPNLNGTANIKTRAVDDSANQEVPTSGITVNTVGASSLWNNSMTPTLASSVDTQAVEVGLKFTTDTAGTINGVKFYKGPNNTGTHVAHLWTSTGTLLATATFTNETATGWQQVMFAQPVSINANTTYVVSYFAPVGRYAANDNYFTTRGFDAGPLHALSSPTSGGNGVYRYGGSGGFPTNTYLADNYWVDVFFSASTSNTTPPTVTAHSPASNATGVPTTSTITATFSEPVQPSTIVFNLTGPGGAVSGTPSYNNSTNTATFTPAAPLAVQTTYTVTVSGARDLSNNVMASTSWSFTTGTATTSSSSSLWSNSVTPAVPSSTDDRSAVEVGLKFTSDTAGTITGVKFYKGSNNTGTHVAHLWTSTGTLLAAATFSNETATGWQQVSFASPVAITANTTYVVSYFAPVGGYAYNSNYFMNTGFDNAPLHAPSNSASGGNGVYRYGSSGGFPTNTYLATNYWVDVLFSAGSSNTTPPTVWRTSSPSDFSAGTFNGTVVSSPTNGGIQLASTARDDFNGSALNSSWSSTSWSPSAQATVTGGVVSISAEQLLGTAVTTTDSGVEGSVSFSNSWQHFGMATSLTAAAGNSWVLFSTRETTNTLFARVNVNGAAQDVNLGTLPTGFHTYRIEPVAGGFAFSVDGALKTTISATLPVGTNLRPVMSDYNGVSSASLKSDWVRMIAGTYTSSTFDAGRTATWLNASWTSTLPLGASIVVQTSSSPDNVNWSPWAAVSNGGTIASPRSRYLRYRLFLISPDSIATPVLNAISITWS